MSREEKAQRIKDALHALAMIEANIENWRYVQVNAEYLPNKQVGDALGQILSLTAPIFESVRVDYEIDALTTFDPIDLID